jgi:hypothetical protein
MSSGTLPGNIQIIRSTGVYGTEMREAIASAIEQVEVSADGRISSIRQDVQSRDLRMTVSKISGTSDDYLLTIENPT